MLTKLFFCSLSVRACVRAFPTKFSDVVVFFSHWRSGHQWEVLLQYVRLLILFSNGAKINTQNMSEFSLRALKIPRVDASWGERALAMRSQSSCSSVCPIWDGNDSYGRPVCPDTFPLLVGGGCSTAGARIDIENAVERPNYALYTQPLCARGVPVTSTARAIAYSNQKALNLLQHVGNPGLDFKAVINF